MDENIKEAFNRLQTIVSLWRDLGDKEQCIEAILRILESQQKQLDGMDSTVGLHRPLMGAAGGQPVGSQVTGPDYYELYHELILEVATVFKGETRHETARRYIRDAETGDCNNYREYRKRVHDEVDRMIEEAIPDIENQERLGNIGSLAKSYVDRLKKLKELLVLFTFPAAKAKPRKDG